MSELRDEAEIRADLVAAQRQIQPGVLGLYDVLNAMRRLCLDVEPLLAALAAEKARADDEAEQAATTVEAMCHWKQDETVRQRVTHETFHFGNVCPYDAMAAVLRGQPDPRGWSPDPPETDGN